MTTTRADMMAYHDAIRNGEFDGDDEWLTDQLKCRKAAQRRRATTKRNETQRRK